MVKREPDSRGRVPGIGRKHSWGRPVKRRFHGNKKKTVEPTAEASTNSSTSTNVKDVDIKDIEGSGTCHRIIDTNILFPQLEKTLCCNQCHGKIKISEFDSTGLGFKINVTCEQQCQKEPIINSITLIGPQGNCSSTMALRALGLRWDYSKKSSTAT